MRTLKLYVNKVRFFAITFILFGSSVFFHNQVYGITNDTTGFTSYFGKVVDVETGKPVVFANIYVSGTTTGTVSNSEGEFVLKVPANKQDKNVNFNYLGYKKLEMPLDKLKATDNIVSMRPDPVDIDEVKVRTNEPLKLIRTAIKNIPENYVDYPTMYTAFYRETIKKNWRYVAVSEAVLDIYKSPYTNKFSSDRVKIYKGRKSQDTEKMDTVLFKLQGGPYTSILMDVVKNPANLLSGEYLDFYDYEFGGIVNIDEKQNYVIEFNQKKGVSLPLYKGKIYLGMDNLAITRLDFSLSELGIDHAKHELVRKKPRNMDVEVVGANYLVKYREVNGKWYLNHVRSEAIFKCKWDKQLFRSKYTTMLEMAVTDRDTENLQKFKYRESSKLSDVFADQVNYFADEDFWGDYNYIKPDETIESAISKLNRKLIER